MFCSCPDSIWAVSYTHLDVYKRQLRSNTVPSSSTEGPVSRDVPSDRVGIKMRMFSISCSSFCAKAHVPPNTQNASSAKDAAHRRKNDLFMPGSPLFRHILYNAPSACARRKKGRAPRGPALFSSYAWGCVPPVQRSASHQTALPAARLLGTSRMRWFSDPRKRRSKSVSYTHLLPPKCTLCTFIVYSFF